MQTSFGSNRDTWQADHSAGGSRSFGKETGKDALARGSLGALAVGLQAEMECQGPPGGGGLGKFRGGQLRECLMFSTLPATLHVPVLPQEKTRSSQRCVVF